MYSAYYAKDDYFVLAGILLYESDEEAQNRLGEILYEDDSYTLDIINSVKVYRSPYSTLWVSNNKIIMVDNLDVMEAYEAKYGSTI